MSKGAKEIINWVKRKEFIIKIIIIRFAISKRPKERIWKIVENLIKQTNCITVLISESQINNPKEIIIDEKTLERYLKEQTVNHQTRKLTFKI